TALSLSSTNADIDCLGGAGRFCARDARTSVPRGHRQFRIRLRAKRGSSAPRGARNGLPANRIEFSSKERETSSVKVRIGNAGPLLGRVTDATEHLQRSRLNGHFGAGFIDGLMVLRERLVGIQYHRP